ncbi:MAG: beta-lactamase family protein, partial [Pseudomonadales bacterium]|nr:beta-lactamase family protein [Pseudomonadales bacterium]
MESTNPESVGLSGTRLKRVTSWLNGLVDDEKLAGASVLIGRHGKVAYFESAGVMDLETDQEFNRDTVVRIYSMTKAVTTVAAMMLYEEGCFQLDDPVSKYIPAFGASRVWAGGDSPLEKTSPQVSPMLVRHLLTHTSGLTYGFMHTTPVDAAYRDARIDFPGQGGTLEQLVDRLASVPLLCQPGSQWNYSVS